jgi:hypothetical protein
VRFHAIESLIPELTVTQYCVSTVRNGFAMEFRTRGVLFAPNKPREEPETIKLSRDAAGWSPLFPVMETVKLSGQPPA